MKMGMNFKKYKVTFFERTSPTEHEPFGILKPIGSQEVWQFENDKMSLIAKAFSQAQGKQKDATSYEVEEING